MRHGLHQWMLDHGDGLADQYAALRLTRLTRA
jgi:hypothetical protein